MFISILGFVRGFLALALGLWVAGAGCLLGCGGMMSAAASQGNIAAQHEANNLGLVVSGEACASAKSHDCCAKKKHPAKTKAQPDENQDATLVQTGSSSSGTSVCPLALSRATVVAKTAGSTEDSTTAVVCSNLSIQNFVEQTAPLATQVRLPNRGHTYLRCCSFLI